jgi:hypothetical protein
MGSTHHAMTRLGPPAADVAITRRTSQRPARRLGAKAGNRSLCGARLRGVWAVRAAGEARGLARLHKDARQGVAARRRAQLASAARPLAVEPCRLP